MINDEKLNLIAKAMEDSEFAEKFAGSENPEEALSILASAGIEMTQEELKEFVETASTTGDEVREGELESVAGGAFILSPSVIISKLMKKYGIKWKHYYL